MTRLRMGIISIIGVASALLLGVVVVNILKGGTDGMGSDSSASSSSLIDDKTFSALDRASRSAINTSHLADGLTPPTNKWYSSMVLNDEPQPGFNVPNSILLRQTGFELSLPKITSTSEGIYGPHTAGIQLTAAEATSYKLTYYDELVIRLSYYNTSEEELFSATFASGSPFAFVTAKRNVKLNLSGGAQQNTSRGMMSFKNGDSWYGAKVSSGVPSGDFSLKQGKELAVFSAPNKSSLNKLAAVAGHPITSGSVSYEMNNPEVKTTLSYATKNGKPTVLVYMPHQVTKKMDSKLTYPSLYGELGAQEATSIDYQQPVQDLEWTLALDDISEEEKSLITSQLRKDIDASRVDKDDTYFGGKQLQRLAQLVMVADALNLPKERSEAMAILKPAIAEWFDDKTTKSFHFDEEAKAIVGREASFGSDKELNDHHFHYGHIIYAASVVAKLDKAFLKEYTDNINLLVADIANYKADERLPLRRNFDAYAGHSWAAGLAAYGDGNNQESSSEAVNAWTAIGLWGDVTENKALRTQGQWMLANEIAAARAYWLQTPTFKEYTSPLVAINWGGKREYKTFFSDEANAKLAIQLLPLNPTMKPYIDSLPKKVFTDAKLDQQYGDYIIMAKGGKDALTAAGNFPDSVIDDGNSRSYMQAFIVSSRAKR